jgi:aspartokinase-like uncharacterized kinase
MDDTYIIKIGGSLFDRVDVIVREIISSGMKVLVVPGGGPFVDVPRQCSVGEEESHWMAISGMEQYGWYIVSHGIPPTDRLEISEKQSVLLPYCIMKKEDPLPHRWDVTSDTIAAWIAYRLGLKLILLKSVDGIMVEGELLSHLTAPTSCDEVDPCFIPFVIGHGVPALVINGRCKGRLGSALNRERVKGTVIGTTF